MLAKNVDSSRVNDAVTGCWFYYTGAGGHSSRLDLGTILYWQTIAVLVVLRLKLGNEQ